MNKKLLVVAALLSSSMAFAAARVAKEDASEVQVCDVSKENVGIAQKNLEVARRDQFEAEAELKRVKGLSIKDKAKIEKAEKVLTNAKQVTKDCLANLEKAHKMENYDCQIN